MPSRVLATLPKGKGADLLPPSQGGDPGRPASQSLVLPPRHLPDHVECSLRLRKVIIRWTLLLKPATSLSSSWVSPELEQLPGVWG